MGDTEIGNRISKALLNYCILYNASITISIQDLRNRNYCYNIPDLVIMRQDINNLKVQQQNIQDQIGQMQISLNLILGHFNLN